MKTRIERDSLGTVKVPSEKYYGSFTTRAKSNFQISGITSPEIFRTALGLVKLSAAETHIKLKLINQKHGKALIQACKEFMEGKFDQEFDIDIFQAGAGTSYNMNCNEIIANRANEILKGKKGEYKFLNPNNDINMGQSTNDVIPTASRIATLLALPKLLKKISELENEINKLAKKHKNLLKVGRTHLQDAVPITFEQEFDSYLQAIQKSRKFIIEQSKDLKILGIGGTAVGTGINSHPKYKDYMIKNLSKHTKIKFKAAKNLTEIANNMNSFMNFSASLRSLTTNILNFVGDLKLMNMGPKAGLNEIKLPEVQPGSSIMPGKVNPSIPECLEMICFQVLGNDKTIELSAQRSQFELNVLCPIIIYNLLQSIEILSNGINTLNNFCVKNIRVNVEEIEKTFNNSLATATALNPYIGYSKTAEVVKNALKKGITIKEEVQNQKLLSDKDLEKALSVKSTTQPNL